MDALSPGYVTEEHRTIMSMRRLVVNDAGADASVTPPSGTCPPACGSGDEKAYMQQGVFTP